MAFLDLQIGLFHVFFLLITQEGARRKERRVAGIVSRPADPV